MITKFNWFNQQSEAIAAFICALLLILGWQSYQQDCLVLSLILLFSAYIIGGYASTISGISTLIEEKELDVDLLMIVAAIGAAGLGIWQNNYSLILDGGILILVFAISGALETIAMQRTERNIRSLMENTPETARVINNHQEKIIDVNQLELGDRVLVKPGELIPIDAKVVSGQSTVNQAPITGESIPVDKDAGDEVFAGSLNGNGVLTLVVTELAENSLIQRVVKLVESATQESPPNQLFIEKFEKIYARVIIIASIFLASLPPVLLGWSWTDTIYRALIFLVVASPCALMAAIMPTLLSGIANGARNGILFKNGAQLEKIGNIEAIAFDKTGTLTTGELRVVEVIPTENYTPEQVLALAASLETYSEHPIGAAIVKAAHNQALTLQRATQIQAYTGQGITGYIQNKSVSVGKVQFIADLLKISLDSDDYHTSTQVLVIQEEQIIGKILLADTIRLEATNIVQQLRDRGIKEIVMLTGDSKTTALNVAQAVGITDVYHGLMPEDKLAIIRGLQTKYGKVAMVGDGINDAPALALADVGIAIGGVSTDVALETADIILMANSLEKLPLALKLGKRVNRVVKQNIIFALSFIVILLLANFLGQINMTTGVIGHEGSTLIVTLSGMRLLK
ncbi:MAG: cadmium-translocating P-type ATPase [Gloeocapsa sp. DLM2.Bin57]|nr:MAG: cadmium-translocating P-type ATPase [Gloeocapsa sp. DLM2.Bin57]